MDGGIVGPQICAAGGGGGGNPPDVPGNQDVEARGSADRMVISGRLATGADKEKKVTNKIVHPLLYINRIQQCLTSCLCPCLALVLWSTQTETLTC